MKFPPLHPGQLEVYNSSARIRVLACGARWGKDRLTIIDMLTKVLYMANAEAERRKELIPAVLAWYVAPTYGLLRQSWEELHYFLSDYSGARYNESTKRCWLPGGVQIEFKSADRPGSLLARGLDYIAVTEAARMKEQAWTQGLSTRLISPGRGPYGNGGLALLNSTPEGCNWYKDLWDRGQADKTGYIKSWRYTSYDNPFINPDELNRQRLYMPANAFAQEYLAEFVATGGDVFCGVNECRHEFEYPQQEETGISYYIGIDWGRANDSTVAIVLGTDGEQIQVVNMLRLTGVNFSSQLEQIKGLAEIYPSAVLLPEKNSLGAPLIEQLFDMIDNPIRPVVTTATSKKQMIAALAVAIEQGEINIPITNDEDIKSLISELYSYRTDITKSGLMTYNAAPGCHDDCVMALAFALSGINRRGARNSCGIIRV